MESKPNNHATPTPAKKQGRLAIIGASYLQLPLIEKAKEMGLETHVFAWAANDVGETAADFFYPISIVEKEKILEVCRQKEVDGICSIASDLAMQTVNFVADAMGLCANSLEATRLSTNKHAMRQAFEAAGLPSPKSILLEEEGLPQTEGWQFPLIIKPADRSGSRGITLVESPDQLEAAIQAAQRESFSKEVLMEEFATGTEYSAEYISQNGKHTFLAVTEKRTTGAPHFIETGHREPALLSAQEMETIQRIIPQALDALKITTGASHSEFKLDEQGNLKLIEIGGRMGGDCIGSHLVPCSTGYDFCGMVIDCALGRPIRLEKEAEGFAVESTFLLTQADLERFEQIQAHEPDRILAVLDFHPEHLGTVTDSSNRGGCYIEKLTSGSKNGNAI